MRDVLKVNEFDSPAGEWGRRRKYFGRRELGPTSPQFTLRSQPEKVSGLPTRQIFYPLSWNTWPSSRISFRNHCPFHLQHFPNFSSPLDTPAKPYCPKGGPPPYGVTSGMNLLHILITSWTPCPPFRRQDYGPPTSRTPVTMTFLSVLADFRLLSSSPSFSVSRTKRETLIQILK